jgi:hypothetical protein
MESLPPRREMRFEKKTWVDPVSKDEDPIGD